MHHFEKKPKKSYATDNSYLIQLDFHINKMMYLSSQYQIVDKFDDREEFKKLMFRFHAVLGKEEEEVWSLVKTVRVLNICKDVLFEGVLQNICYHVIAANNTKFTFTVANFPLMNLNGLISVTNILMVNNETKLQSTRK